MVGPAVSIEKLGSGVGGGVGDDAGATVVLKIGAMVGDGDGLDVGIGVGGHALHRTGQVTLSSMPSH